jgi:general secretion pathway protein M
MASLLPPASSLPVGRTGRWLALGLTLALPAVLWVGLVSPLLEWHADRAARLDHRLIVAQRMDALVAALPQLRQQAASLADSSAAGTGTLILLEGATDAVAAATLQQKLQDMATRVGAEVVSAETLAATQIATQAGAYRQIGLHVSLNTHWSVLIRLLQAIAQSSPRMLVDDVQVHAPRVLMQGPDPVMTAAFTVLGYRADTPPLASPPIRGAQPGGAVPINFMDVPPAGTGVQ